MNFSLINNIFLDLNNNLNVTCSNDKALNLNSDFNNLKFENLLEPNSKNIEETIDTNSLSYPKENVLLDINNLDFDNNVKNTTYLNNKTVDILDNENVIKNTFYNNSNIDNLNYKSITSNDFESKISDNDEENIDKSIEKSSNIYSENILFLNNVFLNHKNDISNFDKKNSLSSILNSNVENIDYQNIFSNLNENVEDSKNIKEFESINFDNSDFKVDLNDADNLNIMKSFEENALIEIELNNENLLENNECNKENIFNQVKDGLLTSLSGSKHIKMQLRPQNLGSVGINIRVLNGKINLEFIVDNSFVENVINENIKQLESILNSSGLLVINDVIVKKRVDSKETIFYKNILKSNKKNN